MLNMLSIVDFAKYLGRRTFLKKMFIRDCRAQAFLMFQVKLKTMLVDTIYLIPISFCKICVIFICCFVNISVRTYIGSISPIFGPPSSFVCFHVISRYPLPPRAHAY